MLSENSNPSGKYNSLIEIETNDNIIDNFDHVEKLDNIIGSNILSQIQIDLKDDVLYKMLRKSNRHREIITDMMLEQVKEGKLYSTPEVAAMLHVPSSTMRGWIQELRLYIAPEEQGRFIKLSPKSVYKVRMVSMLREDNEYSVGHLKEMTLGVDVIDPESDYKEPALNEKVSKLEKQVLQMADMLKAQGQIIGQQSNILGHLIDYDVYKTEGKIILQHEKIIPLLEESTDKKLEEITKNVTSSMEKRIEEEMKEVKDTIKEDLDSEIQEYRRDYENKVQNYTNEQIKKYMDENEPKTFMERLFGKKK